MRKFVMIAGAAALLGGCGDDAPVKNEPAMATSLRPGQYQADWKVTSLRIVDKNPTAATNLKQDATGTTTACVGADNAIDPALFAEDGDSCTIGNPYVRNGRMQMDLTCSREGADGRGHSVLSRASGGSSPNRSSSGCVATERAFASVSAVAMRVRARGSSMRRSHLTRIPAAFFEGSFWRRRPGSRPPGAP